MTNTKGDNMNKYAKVTLGKTTYCLDIQEGSLDSYGELEEVSKLYCYNETDQLIATQFIESQKTNYKKPLQTQVVMASTFYEAEEYHQNYYNQNQSQGYCSYVITPKVEKGVPKNKAS